MIPPKSFLQYRRSMASRLFSATLLVLLPVAAQSQFTYITNNGALTITACTAGGHVTIPDSIDGLLVTCIGDAAFFRNSSLTGVTIGISVTNIGTAAFYLCSNLTNVAIGCQVISIGVDAFYACTSLSNLTIPASVTSIGNRAFSSCHSLNVITVEALNSSYVGIDGVLFSNGKNTLVQFPGGKAGSYTIPDSVNYIGDSAFTECFGLTNITIPNSVNTIGNLAFNRCSSLTGVTIPDSVTSINERAFNNCTALINVTIGGRVNYIGDWAFTACTNLADVSIPNSVTSIGSFAFHLCAGLTNVTIPDSVTNLGANAFAFCTSLTTVTIPDSLTTIAAGTFYRCTGLSNITIGNGVNHIGNQAFQRCDRLAGVHFRGNAPSLVNSFVFSGDDQATVYYLPGNSGWGLMYGSRPTAPWLLPNPLILDFGPSFGVQTNQFGFIISWATNRSVVIESSASLSSPNWSPLATNTLVEGWSYFSDPQWANYPTRFYRIRSQ